MFIFTTKVSKWKAAVVIACIIVLIAAIIIITSVAKQNTSQTTAVVNGQEVEVSYKGIKTDEDRIAFLAAFGWECQAEPVATEEIKIPEEFEGAYASYNDLQKSQGLDLTKYQGKTVKRYTYEVTNYPGTEETIYANLLIYKNRVIGGDVCSSLFRGFMHGFEMP